MSVRVDTIMLFAVPHSVMLDITSEDEHVANVELHEGPYPIVRSQRETRASHDIKHDTEGGIAWRVRLHIRFEGGRVVIGVDPLCLPRGILRVDSRVWIKYGLRQTL